MNRLFRASSSMGWVTWPWGWALALALITPLGAQAQNVVLSGMIGSKALLVIDGGAPRAVGAGEQYKGVQVISVGKEEALVEVAGARQRLVLGEIPVRVGGGSMAGDSLVLQADSRGHFIELGTIDGHTVQFMIDTGASSVTLSRADADRIGLRYQGGQRVRLHTANGSAQGWQVRLGQLRLGEMQFSGVQAVITPTDMPYVLLGNNFLAEFDMTRSGQKMTLRKR